MRAHHAGWVLLFDYAAAASFGAASAVVAWIVVPQTWPGVAVMIAGMLLGFIAALPLFLFFSVLLGGFEIIILASMVGMIAGMVGAMSPAEGVGTVIGVGAIVGFAVQTLVRIGHARIGGEVALPRPPPGGEDRP